MIVWLAMQAFQALFATAISGDALFVLRAFGFLELLLEVGAIIIMGIVFIWDKVENRK